MSGPLQARATQVNPNGLPMVEAATYRCDIRASLTRVWENVEDWEHLPFIHGDNFSSVALVDAGDWGWRAVIGSPAGGSSTVELVTDKPNRRYVARTLEGPFTGMEIWTDLNVLDQDLTSVSVGFHLPDMDADKAAIVGERLVEIYRQLWAEDEAMMIGREAALGRPNAASSEPILLGLLDDVIRRAPFTVDVSGQPVRVLDLDGDLIAFTATCPHRLGPLDQAGVEDGCVTCPWHGFRFDVRTRQSADGHRLTLWRSPSVEIGDGAGRPVSLVWPA